MTCQCPANARLARRNHLRVLAAALMLAAMAGQASAADWIDDTLRGSYTSTAPARWDGFSVGGTMGLSSLNADYGSSTGSQVAYTLRNTALENEQSPSSWTALPSNVTNGRQFGGFVGYNMQWQELVLGFEGAYNRTSSLDSATSDTISRQVTLGDGTQDGVTIRARGNISIVDYATARIRAGYAIGQFLPYASVGVAVGRINYSLSTDVTVVQTPAGGGPTTFVFPTVTQSRNNAFSAGPAFGLGVDVAILPSVFLRAEWEYAAFAPVNGIRAGINTGRIGVGARF